jgi:hypothetical protein
MKQSKSQGTQLPGIEGASEYFCCYFHPLCHQLLGGNHNKMLVCVGNLPVVVALDYSSISLQLN